MSCLIDVAPPQGQQGQQEAGHHEKNTVPTVLWTPRISEVEDEKRNKELALKDCVREWTMTALAEFGSTIVLMFIGCSSAYAWDGVNPAPNPLGSASFGMAVFTGIVIFGDICGAHMNPWVTLINALVGNMTWKKCLVYLISQFFGAFVGYGLALAMIPPGIRDAVDANSPHGATCLTVPVAGMPSWAAILAEFLTTTILLGMVCSQIVSNNSNIVNAIQSGIIVTVLCVVEAPYTANSMNLTRSIPPAVWSGVWDRFWVLPIAHTAALLLVFSVFTYFRKK